MENCNFVIVISSFQGSSAPAPSPSNPTKIIVAVFYPSLVSRERSTYAESLQVRPRPSPAFDPIASQHRQGAGRQTSC